MGKAIPTPFTGLVSPNQIGEDHKDNFGKIKSNPQLLTEAV